MSKPRPSRATFHPRMRINDWARDVRGSSKTPRARLVIPVWAWDALVSVGWV